jgi:hypothetical protein
VCGTLLRSELARVPEAGEGGFAFDYRGVAVANRGVVNVCGRSSAAGPGQPELIEFIEFIVS